MGTLPGQAAIGIADRAIRSSTLFAGLDDERIAWLAAHGEIRELDAGTTVFRLGDAGAELYVVADGEVEILAPGAHRRDEVVARVTAGSWFGEMALLTGEARSATARTSQPTRLLAVSDATFRVLLSEFPAFYIRLSGELSRRLRGQLTGRSRQPTPRLLVIEAPPPSEAGGDRAVRELLAAAAREIRGEIAVLGDVIGGNGAREATLRSLGVHPIAEPLSRVRLEVAIEQHPLTIVRITPGDPTSDPIRALPSARLDLASLEHALASAPAEPLRGRFLSSPIERVLRRALRRSLALVLGAGGAKGFCHIGVLRALESAEIRVDMIVGTSIGALIGGFASLGVGTDEIFEGFRDLAMNFRRNVIDLRFGGASLLRGRKKSALLQRRSEGIAIENLQVPFRAVAADLVSAREVVMASGPLWQAIDAATAVPTVFPPVAVGNQRLVDGWMINPLPADVARREEIDHVIAVDPTVNDRSVGIGDRGGRSWSRRIARFFDVGSRIRIAMRAMDISARDRAAAVRPLIDVCLEPRLGRYASTDVRRYREIVDAGETVAVDQLAAMHRSLRDR